MSIRLKFNFILILILGIGFVGIGWFTYKILQENTQQEALIHAEIMMEAALAIRRYTVKEVKPLLDQQSKRQFLSQSVPAYAATQNFKQVQKKYPDYIYKEAVLNPTNPVHQATGWEKDIVEHFRNHPDQIKLSGVRASVTGSQLYISRPIKITNRGCLSCHSIPVNAPATMIQLYGDANGFGWKFNEIVGAQIVSVPLALPLERAKKTFVLFMGALLGTFITMMVILNFMLHFMLIKPIVNLSKSAKDISMGNADVPEFEVKGSGEIAELGSSFNRMRRSLDNAMDIISTSTDIEVDSP